MIKLVFFYTKINLILLGGNYANYLTFLCKSYIIYGNSRKRKFIKRKVRYKIMSSTTNGNCLLFHGGGLCPLSNRYLSKLAQALSREDIFGRIYMGFHSFECLLNPEEYIKPWDGSLKTMAKNAHGGFYGTSRGIDLTEPTLQAEAIETCKALGITWIGVAGGDGSCRQVAEISEAFAAEGIHLFIPVPLTIDGIEGGYSIGLSPAGNKSLEVLDDLAATNLQTRDNREFSVLFLETQGRNRDDILAYLLDKIVKRKKIGGIPLTDIDLFVIPANYYWDINRLIEAIRDSRRRTIVIYSEGAEMPVDHIIQKTGRKTRVSVVGYLSQMNESVTAGEYNTNNAVIDASVPAIHIGVSSHKSFSLVFNNDATFKKIADIDYWAKLNPREGQKPTLAPHYEELIMKYTPR